MNAGLKFELILDCIASVFDAQLDKRKAERCKYRLSDAGLAAFSVFYTQSPSFLSYQRDLEKRKGKSNAQRIFGLEQIPTDTHIRTLLDKVDAEALGVVYRHIINSLNAEGQLEHFKVKGDEAAYCLLALDGTETFSSEAICCQQCTKTIRRGKARYHHSMIPPVLVHPDRPDVLSLEPEFIRAQDGDEKQDCESKAIKRWLKDKAAAYALEKVIVLCDDLHCHQPQCQAVLARGWDFIFVCKPDSHPTLYGYLNLSKSESFSFRCWNGSFAEIHSYRFANDLPLREGEDALRVNWCELSIHREDNHELLYRNSFATSLGVNRHNVKAIVTWGRTRWKTENENNNTLKTKGYNLEHNYGHGDSGLASVLVSLLLLAFLVHTLFDLFDKAYQAVRFSLGTRRDFFNALRALLLFHLFDSWQHLLLFMIDGLELDLDSS